MLKERVPRTMAITLAGILLAWLIAVPIGIYSAVRQYSVFDYIFTFLGFIGLALPAFLFAIVLVFLIYQKTGWAITGIFSAPFENARWSIAKFWDMIKNLAIPLLVLSTSGAAGLIRILRGTLLDELKKQYVITARSKGLREMRLLFKYPVRLAINPLISTIGWILPAAVGGEVVVSQVLNLPTTGPILIFSIMNQDMYLAGGILLILSSLTLVGTLISDILLAAVDPRIRYR
jgi:peptide/nickel transport system permease protein